MEKIEIEDLRKTGRQCFGRLHGQLGDWERARPGFRPGGTVEHG